MRSDRLICRTWRRRALTTDSDQPAQPASDDAPDDDVLSIEIGGKTVGARLGEAIAAGEILRRPDGKLELAGPDSLSLGTLSDLYNGGSFAPDCVFLNCFMFKKIYGNKAVPIGCCNCYKVKVLPETLRQLMAVNEMAQDFSCSSKSSSEVDRQDNQSLYGSYFFLLGLDKARAVYWKLRDPIDGHPKLGPQVKMVIKRGCTNYEHACGPSNRYTFDPRLEAIEKYFRSKFIRKRANHQRKYRNAMALLELVRTAYRIGDDTYKDFTGGRDLYPVTVSYDPGDPSTAGDDPTAGGEAAGRHSISK